MATEEDSRMARRRAQRTELTTFCPTTFQYNGVEYRAVMQNVAELGAGFRVEVAADDPQMEIGSEVEFEVKTPYGPAKCSGRIIWTKKIGGYYTWGIEFTKLSEDKQDPLRCLIDSPF
jgi:hypothetical protein